MRQDRAHLFAALPCHACSFFFFAKQGGSMVVRLYQFATASPKFSIDGHWKTLSIQQKVEPVQPNHDVVKRPAKDRNLFVAALKVLLSSIDELTF